MNLVGLYARVRRAIWKNIFREMPFFGLMTLKLYYLHDKNFLELFLALAIFIPGT